MELKFLCSGYELVEKIYGQFSVRGKKYPENWISKMSPKAMRRMSLQARVISHDKWRAGTIGGGLNHDILPGKYYRKH